MPGTNLTRVEAQQRANVISKVHSYDVDLNLAGSATQFTARTTVKFAATAGAASFIDLVADKVTSITLNGAPVDTAAFSDSRITLQNLAAENELVIESLQAYTNTGEGMHRFVDPVDDEVYLYTQFEVPDSRRVFAVFEQPDLKSVFNFTVTAPAHWLVVSNQPTPEPVAAGTAPAESYFAGKELATWEFSSTPVMSSYITAIIAGPYQGTRSELVNAEGRTIPLGVFCRASLLEHLDADYIIEKTREGFEFFEKTFGYPYPFAKYDQVFVPEFNMGAMENIGAVTHTEAYVFRSKTEDALKERRVVTVLHELAHMWFGDLVTMKWWNDLWLNESFAEYTSVLATAEATEWRDAWTTFASMEKAWAYRQDQLPSTHPIVAEIRDLEDVMANFDGITYAKGASVLTALVSYVGRDKFFAGVNAYFKKHAYGNTELPDLLTELEATSGRDLGAWAKAWLETAGVNTLTPEFTVDAAGKFSSFKVLQSAHPDYPTIRPHRIAIGCYDVVDGKLTRVHQVEADVAETSVEIPELVGVPQPALVLLNDDDLSFAKVRFDEQSLETVLAHLGSCADSLTRGVLWIALWDAVRDGELAPSRFIDCILQHIGGEDQSSTLRTVLSQLATAANIYLPVAKRNAAAERIAARMLELAHSATAGSDSQFQLFKAFAAFATSEEQLAAVAAYRNGERTLPDLTIDTDLNWVLLTSLAAGGKADVAAIDAAAAADNTASGKQSAARARAALPSLDAKRAAWQENVVTDGAANLIIRSSADGFKRVKDATVLEPFVTEYFEIVNDIWNNRSYQISEEILVGFYPMPLASPELAAASQKWLDDNPDAAASLRRMIIESLSDVERAVKAQRADLA
ncbi:aminopeptidase N [Canibacter oris]|uniref:Aminopeptidase N n=1 Tax=Canibacter oris TaxID=1365628 RepID=A0A840DFV5_9MICO|nr:aminopeptidase N [Canibacter oris]